MKPNKPVKKDLLALPGSQPLRLNVPRPNYDTELIIPKQAAGTDFSGLKKILHLPVNTAGQMSAQAFTLKQLGAPVSFCSYYQSAYNYPTDIPSPVKSLSTPKYAVAMKQFFNQYATQFDIFHFHSGQTFIRYNYSDLPHLKALGKRLVMNFWGSEIRSPSIAKKNNPYVKLKDGVFTEHQITECLKVLSKYMDAVIVADHELYQYLEGYFPKVYLVRQAVDYKKFTPVFPRNDIKKPLIIHAPSNPYIKGTAYIEVAINRLKKHAEFDYVRIEKMANIDALKWIQKADIIIDQLQLGSHGILSIESMLMGKPVITYIRDDLRMEYPPDLPLVSANPNTIEETLRKLILNPQLRNELGIKGRAYAVSHHAPEKIARQLITIYQNL